MKNWSCFSLPQAGMQHYKKMHVVNKTVIKCTMIIYLCSVLAQSDFIHLISKMGEFQYELERIKECHQYQNVKGSPNVGLEPTTLGLRVPCSTDWANRADTITSNMPLPSHPIHHHVLLIFLLFSFPLFPHSFSFTYPFGSSPYLSL